MTWHVVGSATGASTPLVVAVGVQPRWQPPSVVAVARDARSRVGVAAVTPSRQPPGVVGVGVFAGFIIVGVGAPPGVSRSGVVAVGRAARGARSPRCIVGVAARRSAPS